MTTETTRSSSVQSMPSTPSRPRPTRQSPQPLQPPASLRPTSDDWDWQLRGACREADPDLFFHPELERGAARQHRDAQALAVCAECPVLLQCRRHVLAHRETYGVWGGLTEDQREELRGGSAGRRLKRAG